MHPGIRQVREYLVKLRGYSYRQSKWMVHAEVEEDGSLSANALKKFEKRHEKEAVDVSYQNHLRVERVFSHRHKRGQLSLALP